MKNTLFFLFILAGMSMHAQVSINTDGAAPDNSSMLDIKSTSRGLLIPRMTSAERIAIPSPVAGLLVYDMTIQSFYYFNGSVWSQLAVGNYTMIHDGDGDTKVQVEKNPDEDIIRFDLGGIERMVLTGNRLEFHGPDSNYFVGTGSGQANTTGFSNAAFGFGALSSNTSGIGNTAIGKSALLSNTEGYGNTSGGHYALSANTLGILNTASGYYALTRNTLGSRNISVGNATLFNNTSGSLNTAVGSAAMNLNATGSGNVAVGARALFYNTIAGDLVAVGDSALFYNGLGGLPGKSTENTALGAKSLFANTTGLGNTASGFYSSYSNTTGSFNTAHGSRALYSNTSGFGNVAVGARALYSTTIQHRLVAVGDSALHNNGLGAGVGDGNDNTAVGAQALYANTSGSYNTAVGTYAGLANYGGIHNSAFGYEALKFSLNGNYNTATGSEALYNNSGHKNSGFGANSLINNNNGSENTAVGVLALSANQNGSDNTALGYNANVSFQSLYNATAIGANTIVSGNNSVVLGNGANVGIGISAPLAKLHLQVNGYDAYSGLMITNSNVGGKSLSINQGSAGKLNFTNSGIIDLVTMDFNNNRVGINAVYPAHLLQLGTDDAFKPGTSTWGVLSDLRLKDNIIDYTDGWNVLKNIRPVWFTYNGKGGTNNGEKAIGTVAQELQEIAPYMVNSWDYENPAGNKTAYLGVNYHALFFILVNTAKEQHEKIEQLEQKVELLLKRLEKLEEHK